MKRDDPKCQATAVLCSIAYLYRLIVTSASRRLARGGVLRNRLAASAKAHRPHSSHVVVVVVALVVAAVAAGVIAVERLT